MSAMDVDWATATGNESWGSAGHIGCSVRIGGIDLESIDEETRREIRHHNEAIHKILVAHQVKHDPKWKESGDQQTANLILCFRQEQIYVEKIPNGYSNDEYAIHMPWLIVTTHRGRIKIGWRKRVISIDWEDSEVKASGFELFPDEDVTRGAALIHADGYEKAEEYLSVILKSYDPAEKT